MFYQHRIIVSIIVYLFCAFYMPNLAFSQTKVGTVTMPYLKFINSPMAAAMGNSSINQIEEQSALYNPGAFALFSLRNNLSISMPSNSIRLPGSLYLKSYSIGAGINLNQVYAKQINNFNLAIAAVYSKFRLQSKIVQIIDYSPYTLETNDYYEIADYYSFAIALDYFIRIGFGLTHKNIKTDNSEFMVRANALDYGILIEFPVMNIINTKHSYSDIDDNKVNFECTPSFAYVKANIGDDVEYPYDNYFPLPKFSRTGWAMYMAIKLGYSSIISARLVKETENNLVLEVNDLNNYGHEFGLCGAFFYRWGRAEYTRDTHYYKTWGFGINSKGILNWIIRLKVISPSGFFQNVNNHFSISFDYAKYKDNDLGYRDNIKFNKLKLSYSF